MDKNAKELIEKIAKHGGANARLIAQHAKRSISRFGEDAKDAVKKHGPTAAAGATLFGAGAVTGHAVSKRKDEKKDEEKKASMQTIIDDLIKGAQQNTFGRPVSIQQGFDPSPLDLAKFAGMLQALGEQGYSVKEAAEYLNLTEAQVQDIVSKVG